MRRGREALWVRLLVIAGDLLLVNVAFILAYWMRYILGLGGEVEERFYMAFGDYLPVQALIIAVLMTSFGLAGLYRSPLRASLSSEAVRVLSATSVGMLLTLAIVFIYQGFGYSRALFLFDWGLTVGFLWVARILRRIVVALLRRRGIGVSRVMVIGGGPLGHMVMHVIATEPGLGYQLVGYLPNDNRQQAGRFRSLGDISELETVLQNQHIDEVIIALPSEERHQVPSIMSSCQRYGLRPRIVPDLYEMSLTLVDVDDLRGLPLIGTKDVSIRGTNLFVKRAFDLAASLILLVLAVPLWLLIALAIKLDSQGPVLFRQVRLGKGGKPFIAYKFRSMKVGAEEEIARLSALNEADGPIFKMKRDPRHTRVGRLLRRSSLDELPQLLNVIRGEMSLVGPRPPLPSEVEQYEPWHRKRLEVAPGMTGLWQVSGRSELPFDEMVLLDVYYVENWSLALDFTILLRTIPAVISGSGAY